MSDEKTDAKPPVDPFWLVVFGDAYGDAPKCIKCDSEEAFAKAVKTNILEAKEPLFAFAFKGQRIQLSAPCPISSFVVGGKTVKIGEDSPQFDESGHIVPLSPKRTDS